METPPSSYSSDEKDSSSIVAPTTKEAHRDFVNRLLKTMVEMGQARKDILNSESKYKEFLTKEKKRKVQQKMRGLKVSDVEEKTDSDEVEDEHIAEMLKMERMVRKRRSEKSAAEKQKREMEQKVKDILNVTMNSNYFEAAQQVAHETNMPAPIHPVFKRLFKF